MVEIRELKYLSDNTDFKPQQYTSIQLKRILTYNREDFESIAESYIHSYDYSNNRFTIIPVDARNFEPLNEEVTFEVIVTKDYSQLK